MKHTLFKGMMEGLSVDRSIRDDEYNMVKHWHPEYEMQFFLEGKRHFFIEDTDYIVKAGSLVIVDSEKIHNTYSNGLIYHDRILVLFDHDTFKKPLELAGVQVHKFFKANQGVVQIPEADWEYIQKLLTDIADELQKKDVLYQGMAGLRLSELLIYVIRLKQSGSKAEPTENKNVKVNELINEMKQYIHTNLETVGSLEEIADHFFVNKFYLSRMFKQETGYTVTEFINIQKVRRAQKLLEDTDLSVAEISTAVGYENMTYFNRVFKKFIETSPLQYRKKQIAYKKSLREKNNF